MYIWSEKVRATSTNDMWCAPEEGSHGKKSVEKDMQSICADKSYRADFDQLLEVYSEQCVGIQASEVYLAQASAVYVVLIYSLTE